MKVALVHDFLIRLGGAERVLKVISDMFPDAPIFTLLYDEKVAGSLFPRDRIRPSFVQQFPLFLRKRQKYLLPFFPRAVEKFDFSGFDLVLSSNSAFSHGIVTPVHTRHICYCHSPMRYAWDWCHEYIREQHLGSLQKIVLSRLMKKIRMWDQVSSDRPDVYVANSEHVRRRIKKYYRHDAQVIYPPVDVDRFQPQKTHADYFLIVSTLTPYKKIDLAIRLFNKIRKHLIIVGEGSQREYLERMAGDTIEFTGFKNDEVVKEYIEHCRAFIFPGEEDFGITPVEAMACGKPVLALRRGGVMESVIPGVSGEFFYESTIESMEDGLARLLFHEKKYDPEQIRKNAERFSRQRFAEKIRTMIG